VGRLIAVVLFVAVLVPGVVLARAWGLAAGRRAVAAAAVQFTDPTAQGMAALVRQGEHARRVRRLGFLLGVAAIVGSVVLFAEASVFLWIPALAVGLLLGVLLAEDTQPWPRWQLSSPPRRPRRSEQISPWLVWVMRAVVAAEVATALGMYRADEISGPVVPVALVPPLVAWALAEGALLRILVRALPAAGADVPVDEALRTWTAHLVTASASVLGLLPLAALLLAAGIELGDRITRGFDLLPVALVAAGFSALAAGLGVTGFLFPWLRPVRSGVRALAG
jgi:hypothetical protein